MIFFQCSRHGKKGPGDTAFESAPTREKRGKHKRQNMWARDEKKAGTVKWNFQPPSHEKLVIWPKAKRGGSVRGKKKKIREKKKKNGTPSEGPQNLTCTKRRGPRPKE